MSASPKSGRIWLAEGEVHYESKDYGSWTFPVADLRVFGEHTTDHGPYIDDWFMTFVTASARGWYEASVCADGADEFRKQLGSALGAESLYGELFGSTHFDSRIIWPQSMRGQQLFRFTPIPIPWWRRVLRFGMGQIHIELSPEAREYAGHPAQTPMKGCPKTRSRLAAVLFVATLLTIQAGAREWVVWFADEPALSWAVTELDSTLTKEGVGGKGRGIAIRYLKVGLGIEEVLMDLTVPMDFRTWDPVTLTNNVDPISWAGDLLSRLGGEKKGNKSSYQLALVCSVDEWLTSEGSPKLNRHPFFQLTRSKGSQKSRAIKVINEIARRLGAEARIPEGAQNSVIADFWRNHVVRPSFLDVERVTFEERLGVIRMKPVDAEEIEAKSTGTDWANSVENVYK